MRFRRLAAIAAVAAVATVCAAIAVTPAAARSGVVSIRDTQPGSVPALPSSATALGAAYLSVAGAKLVSANSFVLTASVDQLVTASGGTVGVTLIELGGTNPRTWSYHGSTVITAASTYKLAVLMMEAQQIAAGTRNANGFVCYVDSDYEAGWFDDYADGACFTRTQLAQRAGLYSDNTAGHMLVRDVGGAGALNAWAAGTGATQSVFFTDNTTSANDLAALWDAEATGKLGGAAAQAWLYPTLTNTRTEAGVPAGVPQGTVVVHKSGEIDEVVNDAALVTSGPKGAYILTVMTSGIPGDPGWQLIASISSAVRTFEASRTA